MEVAPALLEHWLRQYYFSTELDLGSSGVEPFQFAEFRHLVSLTNNEMDEVLLCDSPTLGAASLRQAIADRHARGDATRVMVTHGSSEAIFLVAHALLEPQDCVLALDPSYQPLYSIAESKNCRIVFWRLRPENAFEPDLEEFGLLMSRRPRMVVLNFPNNPTGASLTRDQLRQVVETVSASGAWLVWDAAFEDLVYQEVPLPSPSMWYRRTIILGTLSKAYGLPGLRVGWCIAPPEVLDRLQHIRDYVTLHLSPLVELVARKAVERSDSLLHPRLEQSTANLDFLQRWVEQQDGRIRFVAPKGGVCVFAQLSTEVDRFCHRLASDFGVLLVPGSCFGHPRFVRLGFGGSSAALRTGLHRVSFALAPCQHTAAPTAQG